MSILAFPHALIRSRNDDGLRNELCRGVEDMMPKLDLLKGMFNDAERRRLKGPGKQEAEKWLKKFIDIEDKIEYWWDQIRFISLKKNSVRVDQVDGEDQGVDDDDDDDDGAGTGTVGKNRMSTLLSSLLKMVSSPIALSYNRYELSMYLREITLETKLLKFNLDKILGDAEKLGLSNIAESSSTSDQSLPSMDPLTAPTAPSKKTMCRIDEDLHRLRQFIIDSENSSSSGSSIKEIENDEIRVIIIVGTVGSGKTDLAKRFYDDDVVKNCFIRKWFFVSQKLDEERIASELLMGEERIGNITKDSSSSSSAPKERYLLVMDDVWNKDSSFWGSFRDALKHVVPGSVLVVTTRKHSVAEAMPCAFVVRRGLSNEEAWYVLEKIVTQRRSDLSLEMNEIGKEISSKCKGLPLSLEIIGSHLQLKNTKEEWVQVLKNDIWEMKELDGHDEFRPIYISYNDLPLRLQRCFLHFTLFKNKTYINVEQLIWLWMAEGYLGLPGQSVKMMRLKGIEYFNILVRRFFLFKFIKGSMHKDQFISCKMRGKVYRFATWFIKFQKKKIHFAVNNRRIDRSFVIVSDAPGNQELPSEWFMKFRFLRALGLSSFKLRELPKEVGNLIFLQFLNLSGTPLQRLPETLCNLCYLEFLDVHFCYMLSMLPKRIGDLQRLGHLRINHTRDELHRMPRGFKKLTGIRTLDVFKVGKKYNKIEILKNFNDLEDIRIIIEGKVDFEVAKLEDKTQMRNLEICVKVERQNIQEAASSIRELKPPPNLKMLKLEGYPGFYLPKWIVAETLIKNLRRLTIRSSFNLFALPELWRMSSLEFLWLYDIRRLRCLGPDFFGLTSKEVKAFPRLETLQIEYLNEWERWSDFDAEDEQNTHNISVMPHLLELVVNGCPKLKCLPFLFLRRIPSLMVSKDGKPWNMTDLDDINKWDDIYIEE